MAVALDLLVQQQKVELSVCPKALSHTHLINTGLPKAIIQ